MKNLIIGLHSAGHDANISVFNIITEEFKYLKFERLTGVKGQYHSDLTTWINYLNHLGHDISEVQVVFVVEGGDLKRNFDFPFLDVEIDFVDHHLAHHWSTFDINSITIDAIGSQMDSLSIYKKNQPRLKLSALHHSSLGRDLEELYDVWFLSKKSLAKLRKDNFSLSQRVHHAGHIMALAAFGENHEKYLIPPKHYWSLKEDKNLKGLQYYYAPNVWENYNQFKDKLNKLVCNPCKNFDDAYIMNSFVKSLHHYWYNKIKRHLLKEFSKNQTFSLTGGVGHNIILNTMLKEIFTNMNPTPHCGDEGLSIGALRYGLYLLSDNNKRFRIHKKIHQIHQQDENFGYASRQTIQQTAQYLKEGKIVMWGQGWGEIGPRALGYRSILVDPCLKDAKDVINKKIKKRAWFRPYGASVTKENYQTYFDLNYESPWMLYQARVKDPDKFKNITHKDGTCRIQTVDKNNKSYYALLNYFGELSGYSVLINTSMNLPGKAMIGTKNQAKLMFDNSLADVLVMGDNIYVK